MSDIQTAPPPSAAEEIAEAYGLDQVVIIGRKWGDGGFETVTTWGRTPADKAVIASAGHFIKHRLMKWPHTAEGETQLMELVRKAMS